MANKFSFEVCAVDRFTKTFKDLNDKASKATRPVQAAGRQFKALGKELHIDKITKGFSRLSQTSATMARNLGLASGPLNSIMGLGMLGGGFAGVAAGVASLSTRFADLGTNAGRAASMMGVNPKALQRFQGAAKLTNLSTEEASQSLGNFGQALHDVIYKHDPQKMGILSYLGVQIKRNKDGTIDAMSTMEDYSRAISRIKDPLTQRAVTDPFGMTAMLPLLRQGPDAMKRLGDEAEKLGLVIDDSGIKKADKFTESLNRLKGAAEGAGTTIGDKLATPVGGVLDWITERMDKANKYWGGPNAGNYNPKGGGGATGSWGDDAAGKGAAPANGPQPARGIRNNNPGNIEWGPFARKLGATGTDGRFATFADPSRGMFALSELLRNYGRSGDNTIDKIIPKYAPPYRKDPVTGQMVRDNDTEKYITDLSRSMGVGRNQPLNIEDQSVRTALMKKIMQIEVGKVPYSHQQIEAASAAGGSQAAAQAVTVHVAFSNAPPGTTAEARGGASGVKTRISYALPTEGPL